MMKPSGRSQKLDRAPMEVLSPFGRPCSRARAGRAVAAPCATSLSARETTGPVSALRSGRYTHAHGAISAHAPRDIDRSIAFVDHLSIADHETVTVRGVALTAVSDDQDAPVTVEGGSGQRTSTAEHHAGKHQACDNRTDHHGFTSDIPRARLLPNYYRRSKVSSVANPDVRSAEAQSDEDQEYRSANGALTWAPTKLSQSPIPNI